MKLYNTHVDSHSGRIHSNRPSKRRNADRRHQAYSSIGRLRRRRWCCTSRPCRNRTIRIPCLSPGPSDPAASEQLLIILRVRTIRENFLLVDQDEAKVGFKSG